MSLTHRALSTVSLTLLLLAATTGRARADETHGAKAVPAPAHGHAAAGDPTPEEAKALLVSGNDRFVRGLSTHPHQDKKRLTEVGAGQRPFATVLSCSDSHAPPELVFDRGFGDVFSVRVAGSVVEGDPSGSVEYGIDHLGTPLLVVMGHTKCGLAAKDGVAEETAHAKSPGVGAEPAPEVIRASVLGSMAALMRSSEVIRERVHGGKTVMVGAVLDVGTGGIEWLGRHPDESRLVAEAKKGATDHGAPHGSSHGAEAKKAAADHGSPHGGAEAKKAGATDHDAPHGEGPEATAGTPEHGKAPPPPPPPNLPVAFAIVTLAATIGGVISSRLIRS